MLFNSFEFMFVFCPVVLLIYFFLNKQRYTIASKSWLVLASLFFYSWWNIKYLPLILCSIIFNFSVGTALGTNDNQNKKRNRLSQKAVLIFGILTNLILLGYYKYTDFFIQNINLVTKSDLTLLHIILPLGISFFTFTQIAYLVDAYKGEVKEMDYLNYSLFVTFFPHLIAGPILHYSEMMPQFDNSRAKVLNYKNIAAGLFLFTIGLLKKMLLADSLAIWANSGFDVAPHLSCLEAWATSLSYTFQIYFDFSGYTDMALGTALMFNIKLPQNFNSPYKARSVQDFWKRWHMTLSRFLRDYVYIPMGGNRLGESRTYTNLLITFILCGFWHGASWMYILWGTLHGLAVAIHRMWAHLNLKMNSIVAWLLTFNFINATWVIFRAKNWHDATKVFTGMISFHNIVLPHFTQGLVSFKGYLQSTDVSVFVILVSSFILIFLKNSTQITEKLKPSLTYAIILGIMLYCGISLLFASKLSSPFLYFNF